MATTTINGYLSSLNARYENGDRFCIIGDYNSRISCELYIIDNIDDD